MVCVPGVVYYDNYFGALSLNQVPVIRVKTEYA